MLAYSESECFCLLPYRLSKLLDLAACELLRNEGGAFSDEGALLTAQKGYCFTAPQHGFSFHAIPNSQFHGPVFWPGTVDSLRFVRS